MPIPMVEFDREQFKITVTRVCEFLPQKAMREGRRADQNNKTIIGDVSFWFELKYDERGQIILNQDYILAFGATPDLWDHQKIRSDIDEKERIWLMQNGIAITGLTPY